MFKRLVALLALLTTVALLGDAAQVICFGEDGHVAFERLLGAEHLGPATPTRVGAIVAPASHESPERVHVDVSLGEVGIKNRLAAMRVPGAVFRVDPFLASEARRLAAPRIDAEATTLSVVRITVLRI